MRPRLWIIAGALVLLGRAGGAQLPRDGAEGRMNVTRHELDSLAVQADAAAASTALPAADREAKQRVAALIRERLRDGDFRPGDRIALEVEGASPPRDTIEVHPGPVVYMLALPELSLRGVLRSEVESHLTKWITRFYKNATVRAVPLVQLGVLGEVSRPGYYRVPADITIGDAIMAAGGPTPRADMPRTVVRRRSKEWLSKRVVRDAMASRVTLDQLGLNAGDEFVIGEKRQRNWMGIAQLVALVTGLAVSLRASGSF